MSVIFGIHAPADNVSTVTVSWDVATPNAGSFSVLYWIDGTGRIFLFDGSYINSQPCEPLVSNKPAWKYSGKHPLDAWKE